MPWNWGGGWSHRLIAVERTPHVGRPKRDRSKVKASRKASRQGRR